MHVKPKGLFALAAGAACLFLLGGDRTAFAQGSDCTDRAACGEVSPLIPMQSAEAIHLGLIWKKRSPTPKLLFHARFPEYMPNDVADPAVVDAAIAAGALTNGQNDFSPALRDVLHPSKRDGSDLAFETHGSARKGELRVHTPRLPAQAVPGLYMLFVVDKKGVLSTSKLVVLDEDDHGDDDHHHKGDHDHDKE
jgi:galactose oxidase-like protein